MSTGSCWLSGCSTRWGREMDRDLIFRAQVHVGYEYEFLLVVRLLNKVRQIDRDLIFRVKVHVRYEHESTYVFTC